MLTTATPSTAEHEQIDRLLAVARETIATVRYCWVATQAVDAGANARAVRSFAGVPGGDVWTRRFLTRRGSRKVAEIRRDPRVTLAYQADSGDAYVALAGCARLIEDRTEMHDLWYGNVAAPFADEFVDANMIVVRVDVDRIEIHARGVTAEPFGHGRTVIERRAGGGWHFVSG
jgi:general stress protein 26